MEAVEAKLDMKPSLIGRRGEHIGDNPQHALYQTNIWVRIITVDPSVPFERQMDELLRLLETKKGNLLKILSLVDVSGVILLGFSSSNGQGSAHFPHGLLARVAALGLDLNLDLYPPGEN